MNDLDAPPTPARLEAAAAVRRLVHAMAGHLGEDEQLQEVARAANELAEGLERQPNRVRPTDQLLRYPEPVAEGGDLSCWPDCMVAGVAHPSSTALRGRRQGDESVITVTLGPANEGLPGMAHGGIVASLFDEAMGFAGWMDVVPTVTAWLRIEYRAPVPIGRPLEVRARMASRDGRKIMMEGRATVDGELVAEAEGLFIVPREHESEH